MVTPISRDNYNVRRIVEQVPIFPVPHTVLSKNGLKKGIIKNDKIFSLIKVKIT